MKAALKEEAVNTNNNSIQVTYFFSLESVFFCRNYKKVNFNADNSVNS